MASIAYQAHPPTAINLSLSPLDLNTPPDSNGQYHSYSAIHSPRSGSKFMSNGETVSQAVIIPFGWKRELHDSRIVYKSPTDILLWSLDEVARYLMSDGTCKCGLECPFQIDQVFNFDANIRFQKYSTSQPSNERFCSHKAKLNAITDYNQHPVNNQQQAHNNNSSIHIYKNAHYHNQMDYTGDIHQRSTHDQHEPQHSTQHSDYGYEGGLSTMHPPQSHQPGHQMNGYIHPHTFHQMPQTSHYIAETQQPQPLHHHMAINPVSVNYPSDKRLTHDVTAVTASITEVIPSVGQLIHHHQAPPSVASGAHSSATLHSPQPVQYSFIVPQQILVNPILNPVIQPSASSTSSSVNYHHHPLTPNQMAPPFAQQSNAIAIDHMSPMSMNHHHQQQQQPHHQHHLDHQQSDLPIEPVDFSKRKVNVKVNGKFNNQMRSHDSNAMLHMDNLTS